MNKRATWRNLAILGPTGSGKTAVAHCLAETYQSAEIVSCDSMQVYRGMNIGVAKPTPQELANYNYHLVDMLDINESWNLDRFLNQARPLLEELNQNDQPALLVGGTGLYAKALIYDYQLPAADSRLYQKIFEQTKTSSGRASLIQEAMQHSDREIPRAVIENPRRLARAVEIIRLNGVLPDNFGDIDKSRERAKSSFQQFIIIPPSHQHRQAIIKRVNWMLDNGWIEETRELLNQGLLETPTARQVLGYREVAAFLHGEIATRQELAARIAKATWHYARRQRTWFRHQHPGAVLMTLRSDISARQIASAILTESRL